MIFDPLLDFLDGGTTWNRSHTIHSSDKTFPPVVCWRPSATIFPKVWRTLPFSFRLSSCHAPTLKNDEQIKINWTWVDSPLSPIEMSKHRAACRKRKTRCQWTIKWIAIRRNEFEARVTNRWRRQTVTWWEKFISVCLLHWLVFFFFDCAIEHASLS